MLDSFESKDELLWSTEGTYKAVARFEAVGSQMEISFKTTQGDRDKWRVDIEAFPGAGVELAFRIFDGVFQAVKTFLEVRQPMRLAFSSNAQPIAELFQVYLARPGTSLRGMGYEMAMPLDAAPVAEFVIEKTTPSKWNEGTTGIPPSLDCK